MFRYGVSNVVLAPLQTFRSPTDALVEIALTARLPADPSTVTTDAYLEVIPSSLIEVYDGIIIPYSIVVLTHA